MRSATKYLPSFQTKKEEEIQCDFYTISTHLVCIIIFNILIFFLHDLRNCRHAIHITRIAKWSSRKLENSRFLSFDGGGGGWKAQIFFHSPPRLMVALRLHSTALNHPSPFPKFFFCLCLRQFVCFNAICEVCTPFVHLLDHENVFLVSETIGVRSPHCWRKHPASRNFSPSNPLKTWPMQHKHAGLWMVMLDKDHTVYPPEQTFRSYRPSPNTNPRSTNAKGSIKLYILHYIFLQYLLTHAW